jgi:hypothetical protein
VHVDSTAVELSTVSNTPVGVGLEAGESASLEESGLQAAAEQKIRKPGKYARPVGV